MRILLVSTQLPPYNGSGNIRLLNYINQLSRLGHTIDVLTVAYPRDSIAYDEKLEGAFDKKVNIYRLDPGFFYKLFYRKKSVEISNSSLEPSKTTLVSKLRKALNTIIKNYLLIPDSFVQWINPAYQKGRELMLTENYDLMFTVHETPSSHLVGYKLKKKYPDLNWVGYWSDPWNGDTAHRVKQSKFKKNMEEKLERKVITQVDKILFTTKKTKDFYREKYNLPFNKSDIVFRGYDLKQYEKIEKANDVPKQFKANKINLVHVGTIYRKLRNIDPLCEALHDLKIKHKNLYDRLNIIFLGQFDNDLDGEKLKRFDNVQVIKYVPYEEALKFIVNANVLLLYGNSNSTQVPGKVYEYLGSKAAIFTILGDASDELKFLMEKVNKGPTTLNTKQSIYEELINIVEIFNSDSLPTQWKEVQKDFQWPNIGKDLEKKIIVN